MNIAKTNIEVLKVQRGCEVAARNTALAALAQAKKEKKEVIKEQEQAFLLDSYNNCVYLQGMDFLIQRPVAKTTTTNK
jgi:hypothetical protein